jgi:chaperonin cofactor prefoldin
MSDEVKVLRSRVSDLESRLRRVEKKQKEADKRWSKVKPQIKLFLQRLRQFGDIKF